MKEEEKEMEKKEEEEEEESVFDRQTEVTYRLCSRQSAEVDSWRHLSSITISRHIRKLHSTTQDLDFLSLVTLTSRSEQPTRKRQFEMIQTSIWRHRDPFMLIG